MTGEAVHEWLEAYVEAWRTLDPDAIRALFTEHAQYRSHPWDEPIHGADDIVAAWRKNPDEPDSWQASYRPVMVDGDRAFAKGQTFYDEDGGKHYFNLFELRFEDGKCAEFTDWYMKKPGA